jgi:hypothetical protein
LGSVAGRSEHMEEGGDGSFEVVVDDDVRELGLGF